MYFLIENTYNVLPFPFKISLNCKFLFVKLFIFAWCGNNVKLSFQVFHMFYFLCQTTVISFINNIISCSSVNTLCVHSFDHLGKKCEIFDCVPCRFYFNTETEYIIRIYQRIPRLSYNVLELMWNTIWYVVMVEWI